MTSIILTKFNKSIICWNGAPSKLTSTFVSPCLHIMLWSLIKPQGLGLIQKKKPSHSPWEPSNASDHFIIYTYLLWIFFFLNNLAWENDQWPKSIPLTEDHSLIYEDEVIHVWNSESWILIITSLSPSLSSLDLDTCIHRDQEDGRYVEASQATKQNLIALSEA